jgi:hypothetical protein
MDHAGHPVRIMQAGGRVLFPLAVARRAHRQWVAGLTGSN